jgi:PPOX class probable F420-dependent enzyme
MIEPIPEAPPRKGNQRSRVRMSDDEVSAYLHDHTGTIVMSTILGDGSIHSVAMWYGFVGDKIGVTTKSKSQKVRNLLRDPRMTLLVESGQAYDELMGVELVGSAEVIDDPATLREIVQSLRRRRGGPQVGEISEAELQASIHNRVAIVHTAQRVVSWDHRKLQTPG